VGGVEGRLSLSASDELFRLLLFHLNCEQIQDYPEQKKRLCIGVRGLDHLYTIYKLKIVRPGRLDRSRSGQPLTRPFPPQTTDPNPTQPFQSHNP
jgi:hypothetical protein